MIGLRHEHGWEQWLHTHTRILRPANMSSHASALTILILAELATDACGLPAYPLQELFVLNLGLVASGFES